MYIRMREREREKDLLVCMYSYNCMYSCLFMCLYVCIHIYIYKYSERGREKEQIETIVLSFRTAVCSKCQSGKPWKSVFDSFRDFGLRIIHLC